MAQLSKGHTYNPGDVVDAADLNALVDSATALAGLITDPTHSTVNASSGDKVLVSRAGVLKQADVSTFPSGITSVHLTAAPTSVFNITGTPTITTSGTFGIELDDQAPNKFLAGPVSGSAATPAFRVLNPSDLPIATIEIAANLINWNLGNVFQKNVVSLVNFTFSNPNEGQIIRVHIKQTASFDVNFPTGTSGVFWPGGTAYTPTLGVGRHDIVTLHYIDGHFWGTFEKDFRSV